MLLDLVERAPCACGRDCHYLTLLLTRGKAAKISPADADLVRGRSWHVDDKDYPRCRMGAVLRRLHQHLLNTRHGHVVDHLNRDTLDNRRCNLRLVTLFVNARNHKRRVENTSGVNGVTWDRRKRDRNWTARINVNGICHHLGRFDTKEEAAAARRAAEQLFWDVCPTP